MAKTQEVPTLIRAFNKTFERLAYRYHASEAFDDFLTYTIYVFDEQRNERDLQFLQERYGEDYEVFPMLFREFLLGMEEATKTSDWYDLLGIYYEIITSRWKSSNMGQFFTPHAVCDLMTGLTGDAEPIRGTRVMDCACGSGRTLLSFHAKNLVNTFFANDLDAMATKMCIVNFLVHGVVGEVTCSDALRPDDFRWGYKVNHRLYPFGMVSCRPIIREQSTVHTFWADVKAENVQKSEQPTAPQPQPKQQPQQLTFF